MPRREIPMKLLCDSAPGQLLFTHLLTIVHARKRSVTTSVPVPLLFGRNGHGLAPASAVAQPWGSGFASICESPHALHSEIISVKRRALGTPPESIKSYTCGADRRRDPAPKHIIRQNGPWLTLLLLMLEAANADLVSPSA